MESLLFYNDFAVIFVKKKNHGFSLAGIESIHQLTWIGVRKVRVMLRLSSHHSGNTIITRILG